MPTRHWISELPRHVGESVAVLGWVVTTRSSGKIAFVVVRDGSGQVQGVLSKADVPPEAWDRFGQLTQETSVRLDGEVRADKRSPSGVELTVKDVAILGASPEFPISPKEHGTAFLMEHRHLWLRSKRQVAIARECGAGPFTIFRHILWPVSRPWLLLIGALVFCAAAGSFLEPRLLGSAQFEQATEWLQRAMESEIGWPYASVMLILLLSLAVLPSALILLSRRWR